MYSPSSKYEFLWKMDRFEFMKADNRSRSKAIIFRLARIFVFFFRAAMLPPKHTIFARFDKFRPIKIRSNLLFFANDQRIAKASVAQDVKNEIENSNPFRAVTRIILDTVSNLQKGCTTAKSGNPRVTGVCPLFGRTIGWIDSLESTRDRRRNEVVRTRFREVRTPTCAVRSFDRQVVNATLRENTENVTSARILSLLCLRVTPSPLHPPSFLCIPRASPIYSIYRVKMYRWSCSHERARMNIERYAKRENKRVECAWILSFFFSLFRYQRCRRSSTSLNWKILFQVKVFTFEKKVIYLRFIIINSVLSLNVPLKIAW